MDLTRRALLTGTPAAALSVFATPTASAASLPLAQRIYNRMLTMRGQKYVWGGESLSEGGFDCSGLLQWAYRTETGITLPRVASQQIASPRLSVVRRAVPIASAHSYVKPLHVVFFHGDDGGVGHVAIATGGEGFFGANYFSAVARELTYYVAANGVNDSTFTRYAGINKTFFSVKDPTSEAYTHVSIAQWIEPVTGPAATVTKRVQAGVTLNVRAGASSTSRRVGTLTAGSAVTGVVTNGWMRISAGAYAGRYVGAAHLM